MNGSALLRLAALMICVVSIVAPSRLGTNLDWSAAFLIPAVFTPILFGWLLSQRALADAQWSQCISWREPFLPMSKYPFRYWFFVGQCVALAGTLSMLVDLKRAGGYTSFGATFLFLGLAMLAGTKLAFARVNKRG